MPGVEGKIVNFCKDCKHRIGIYLCNEEFWRCRRTPRQTYSIYGPTGRKNVELNYDYCDWVNPTGECTKFEQSNRRWWQVWRWFR